MGRCAPGDPAILVRAREAYSKQHSMERKKVLFAALFAAC